MLDTFFVAPKNELFLCIENDLLHQETQRIKHNLKDHEIA